ncbi:MAG TPA: DUF3857 domain-containing protein [Burkholderiaceae bacterium]|jgi:transglutaminase-like putative cysteine protease
MQIRFNRILLLMFTLAFPICALGKQAVITALHYGIDKAPVWVDRIDATAIRSTQLSSGYVQHCVLKDVQVNVSTNAETTVYRHVANIPVADAGIAETAKISIQFYPEYQTLILHDIALVRHGVRIDKLDRRHIKIFNGEQDADRRIYDGSATLIVQVDGVQVNDLVDYSYSVRGVNPILGAAYSGWFALGFDGPVDFVQVRLLAPASRQLYYQLAQTAITPEVSLHNDVREWRWKIPHVSAVKVEDMLPVGYIPFPRVQISEYDRWSDVTKWAMPIYRIHGALSPEIVKLVDEWQRDSHSDEEFAIKALDFVQQHIRYLAVEIGMRSHRPAHPNQVFKQHAGDCKDKSQLLVAMLHQAGMRAYPALVSHRFGKAVADGLPSPLAFDHVIVLAEIDGKRYWLDPTLAYQEGPLSLRGATPFGKALVIGDASGGLTDVGISRKSGAAIHIEENFEVAGSDQPVVATVKSRYTGNSAEQMREQFARNSSAQITRHFLNDYAARYSSVQLISLTHDDHPEVNEFVVTAQYQLRDFFKQGNGQLTAYVYGWALAPYVRLPQMAVRSMPLSVSFPLSVTHDIDIHFTSVSVMEAHQENRSIKNSMVQFGYTQNIQPDRMRWHFILENLSDTISPDSVDAYLTDLNEIRNYGLRKMIYPNRQTQNGKPLKLNN